jgi:hypothetical protein
MIALTTFQCPQCMKVFITKIVIRQTIGGGRPTLQFPGTTCNGMIGEEECNFDFRTLQVESFDIPLDASRINPSKLIKPHQSSRGEA